MSSCSRPKTVPAWLMKRYEQLELAWAELDFLAVVGGAMAGLVQVDAAHAQHADRLGATLARGCVHAGKKRMRNGLAR